ncbi:MAG: hypothetical protein FJ149_10340, partial [Euryarchaeota archaeon]|nr:hypothetical protein [Euryarchaeota archaeon]
FEDGTGQQLLVFPPGGGVNSTSVAIPAGMEVLNATVDLEGRRALNGTAYSSTDFFLERGNRAWAGNATMLPPVLPPGSFEDQNITAVPGIKLSDNVRYTTTATYAAPYHLFELSVGEGNVTGFNLTWEGIGFTMPEIGFGDNGATLYLWDRLARIWTPADTQGVPEVPAEVVLTANVSVSAARYIDIDGYITAFVAPKRIQYDNEISTDYVKLVHWGWQSTYPEDLRLDVGADGTVEWSHPGPLNATRTFSGPAFVSAMQKAVDNATGDNASVPFRFSCASGGLLYLSNLSIGYGPKDLPPRFLEDIPLLETGLDRPAYAALDLTRHFDDDGGAANLSFSVVHNTGPSHVAVAVNGTFLDIVPAEPGWSGSEQSRVRATDARGHWAESNNFTVRVNPGPAMVRFLTEGLPAATQDTPYEFTFAVEYTGQGTLSFTTNSTLLALGRATGTVSFSPRNRDVGVHCFGVDVSDGAGVSASGDFSLTVLNLNDPPSLEPVWDQTATEDRPFSLGLEASDPDLDIGRDELRFSANYSRLSVSTDGVLSFTPGDGDVGVHRVRVTVQDAGGLSDSREFALTVLNVNDPPSLGALPDITTDEDSPFSVRLIASDPDAGDTLTYSSDTPLLVISADGWINFTPVQAQVGRWPVSVTVRDRAGAAARGAFNLTVVNVNDPPAGVRILNPVEGTRFPAGKAVSLEAEAQDEDGDELEFSWYVDGKLLERGRSVTARGFGPGAHSIRVSASDGNLTVDSPPVNITVFRAPEQGGASPLLPIVGIVALVAVGLAAALYLRRRSPGNGST